MNLLWSIRHGKWWGENNAYTSEIVEAKLYTDEEAERKTDPRFGSSAVAVPITPEEQAALAAARPTIRALLVRLDKELV